MVYFVLEDQSKEALYFVVALLSRSICTQHSKNYIDLFVPLHIEHCTRLSIAHTALIVDKLLSSILLYDRIYDCIAIDMHEKPERIFLIYLAVCDRMGTRKLTMRIFAEVYHLLQHRQDCFFDVALCALPRFLVADVLDELHCCAG